MSFILDALKKADAERRSGTLPGLTTAVAAPLPYGSERSPAWRRWACGALVLSVAIGIIAVASQREENPPSPASAPTVPAATPAMPPSAPPVAQAKAEPTAKDQAAASTGAEEASRVSNELPAPPPAPRPATRPEKPARPAAVPTGTAPLPDARTAAAASAASLPKSARAVPSPSPVAPAASATPDIERLPLAADLPEPLRRELPPLAVTGSMYSDNPANRMVLVNRRIFREGDEVAPELTIEQLTPRGAVMRYRDQRFRLPY